MKFAQELFPMGTYPRQSSPGLYIDETKSKNFDVIAESMHKDIFPVGIYSGDNTSGTGKTTCLSQDGCYLTWKINQIYKLNNTFTSANIFFKVDDLLKQAPIFAKEQPYSVLCLDEPDELNEHQMKKKSFELRSAFRKLRQLNLIFLITSHSFFELPKFYALNRAQYLVNVSFSGKFDRGYFKFYGPKAKKLLYFKGKREWDYDCHKEDFQGRFGPAYSFFPNCKEETEKYRRKKYQDMVDELSGKNRPVEIQKKDLIKDLFRKLNANLPKVTQKDLANAFGISERTASRWINDENDKETLENQPDNEPPTHYTNYLMNGENNQEQTDQPNEIK